jgi:GTP-binding protein HflX
MKRGLLGHPGPPRAVMVGVQTRGVTDATYRAAMAELASLGRTLGLTVVSEMSQRRSSLGSSVLGKGKLEELAQLVAANSTEPPSPFFVLVNHELSQKQVNLLQDATGATVLPRTAVILRIFEQHARTKEARLQVPKAGHLWTKQRLTAD